MPRRREFVPFVTPFAAHRPRSAAARQHTSSAMRPLSARTPLLPNRAPGREDGIRWRETASFVLPYIVPDTLRLRLIAAASVLCVLAKQGASLVTPFAYKLAVDTLTQNLLPGAALTVPYLAIALYIGASIASTLFGGMQGYTYSIVAATCTRRFSVAMFTHLQNLSLAFHLSRRTGEVTRIMDRGSSSIETVVNTVIFTLFPT